MPPQTKPPNSESFRVWGAIPGQRHISPHVREMRDDAPQIVIVARPRESAVALSGGDVGVVAWANCFADPCRSREVCESSSAFGRDAILGNTPRRNAVC